MISNWQAFMTPPLTTIHQPKDELGELAIDVLIHRMADPPFKQRLQLNADSDGTRFRLAFMPLANQICGHRLF